MQTWFPHPREWHWPQLLLLGALPLFLRLCAAAQLPPPAIVPLWLLLNFSLLALAEHWLPFRQQWRFQAADAGRDAGLFGLNAIVDLAADATLAMIAVAIAGAGSSWPLPLQILLGVHLAELGSYALHRLSHAPGWLWRVHAVHHLPDRLNAANGFTAHPINALYNKLARVAPLILIGFSADAVQFVALFGLTQSLVTHANVRGRIGFLNLLIGSAELHRLHHSTKIDEARNFGTSVPFWDILFGTFRLGPAPQTIGVADPQSYPSSRDVAALLAFPLTPRPAPAHDGAGDLQ